MDKFKMVPVDLLNRQFHADNGLRSKAQQELLALVRAPDKGFDEAAERAEFEEFIETGAVEAGENEPSFSRTDYEGVSIYINPHIQGVWFGWLACARLKAGVTGHE